MCVVCMCVHVWLHLHTCGGERTVCRYLLALWVSSESNHVISFESRLSHLLSTPVNPNVCISNTFQNQELRSLFLFRLRRKGIELKRLNWKFENIGVMKPICLFVCLIFPCWAYSLLCVPYWTNGKFSSIVPIIDSCL